MITSTQSIWIQRNSIYDSLIHIANIGKFALVARVIRKALSKNAKIAKEFIASINMHEDTTSTKELNFPQILISSKSFNSIIS